MKNSNYFYRLVIIATFVITGGVLSSCDDSSGSGKCSDAQSCDTEGETSCVNNSVSTCTMQDNGCKIWIETTHCDDGFICTQGSCEVSADCGNGTIDDNEVCDGSNIGTETCETQGFGPGSLGCNASCTSFDTSNCSGAASCGNGTIDNNEVCDGSELNGETCESQGFYGGNLGCSDNCGDFDTSSCTGGCGDGILNGSEACDGTDFGTATCDDYGSYGGTLSCNSDCTIDSSLCSGSCGDGIKNGNEACDGNDFGTSSCSDYGFYTGNLVCDASCMIDNSGCSEACGDGIINGSETCDGPNFNGATCADYGFYGGNLSCNVTTCTIRTDNCDEYCGDGIINGTEECDGASIGFSTCHDFGYYVGNISCDSNCNYDTSGCDQYCGDGVKTDAEECDGSDFGTLTCADYGFAGGTLGCDGLCGIDTSNCIVCNAGDFKCDGNEVLECDGTTPGNWVSQSPAEICNASSGESCDASVGSCVNLTAIGGTTPTATFYQFAVFNSGSSAFLGGYDLGAHGNFIYVNRSGSYLDIYRIDIQDSDGDGIIDPNQHPNDPTDQGPMEQRTITLVATYTKNGDNAPLGSASRTEMWADANALYSLGPDQNGDVTRWDFATHTRTVVANSSSNITFSLLGFGEVDQTWFAAGDWGCGSTCISRLIYSWHNSSSSWVAEFMYPDLNGAHMDGLAIVKDPNTGTQYVYVTDMTSDFIGQYRRNGTGGWVQENLFQYNDTTGSSVEGMGFGPLNHFWITGGNFVYEIGGGDFTQYLQK